MSTLTDRYATSQYAMNADGAVYFKGGKRPLFCGQLTRVGRFEPLRQETPDAVTQRILEGAKAFAEKVRPGSTARSESSPPERVVVPSRRRRLNTQQVREELQRRTQLPIETVDLVLRGLKEMEISFLRRLDRDEGE